MEFGQLLNTALSIVAIATLAGLGLLRGTVTNLRETLKDAREDITDKDRRHEEDEKTITRLTGDLDALARIVTGEARLAQLGEMLKEHHELALARLVEIEALLKQIIADIKSIKERASERE